MTEKRSIKFAKQLLREELEGLEIHAQEQEKVARVNRERAEHVKNALDILEVTEEELNNDN